MNIIGTRVFNIILSIILITQNQWALLFYVFVAHTSIEYLNTQCLYKQHCFKIYNAVFITYELVLLERLVKRNFSTTIEWWLNNAEHIAFGIVICLKIYVYLAILVFKKDTERHKRLLATVFIFNTIGWLNEVYQNFVSNRTLFTLTTDSQKDILMNLYGTAIFFLTVLCRIAWLKKPQLRIFNK